MAIDHKPGMAGSQGNSACIKLFEEMAEACRTNNRIQSVCVVWCENAHHNASRFAGSKHMENSLFTGLHTAALRVMERIHSVHLDQPSTNEFTPDCVGWDISKGPACYDFFVWLVLQEMNRRKHEVGTHLKVGFRMNAGDEEMAIHNQLRKQFYDNVIFPGLTLMGAEFDKEGKYAQCKSIERYTFAAIVEASRRGEFVPLLKPSDEAKKAVEEYLGEGSPPPVTITLREATYHESRNSNVPQWLKVADELTRQGERVILIRDTNWEKMKPEPYHIPDDYEICVSASYDVDVRMALYEAAKCNLFSSNGPWHLAVFGTKPWLCFVPLDSMSGFFPETPQFWTQWHGINPKVGEQFPWSQPYQRIVDARDTADVILMEWERMKVTAAGQFGFGDPVR